MDLITQTANRAAANSGPSSIGPGSSLSPGSDVRWRRTPNPVDGEPRFDPKFFLPSIAGPAIRHLSYDSGRAMPDDSP